MSTRNVDRRTQRTRQSLKAAFVELMLTRGYDVLTAEEICRKANVGRSTFYLHYSNKEQLLGESMVFPASRMADCLAQDVTREQLTPMLDHIREQCAANKSFLADPVRRLWVRSLAAVIESRLAPAPRTLGPPAKLPLSLVALMIAEMQVALITHWVTGGYTLKSELIAATLIANTHAMQLG